MRIIYIFMILFITIRNTIAFGFQPLNPRRRANQSNQSPKKHLKTKQPFYFTQKLDHFNASDDRDFKQKFLVQQKYFNKTNGSILLYLCGQWECTEGNLQSYAFIASNTSSLVIALQHRYYGQSLPMGDDSLDIQNLVYLSVEQAIEDIKQFIQAIQRENTLLIKNHPWFVVGDSYSGALAGWFRLKYPSLVIGALSSSGVFNLTQQYGQYDRQVYESLKRNSKQCVNRVISQNIEAQAILRKPDKGLQMKNTLVREKMTDVQFLYYMAVLVGGYVQFGNRNYLCELFQVNSQILFFQMFQNKLNMSEEGISAQSLKNPLIYKTRQKIGRAWRYQVCSQIGLFAVASHQFRIRSKLIDRQFYRSRCLNIYGVVPNMTKWYQVYGNIGNATNIISVNGVQDPWRWASIQQNNTNIISFLIDCQQCSHCVLSQDSDEDRLQVLQVREYVINIIKTWISDQWQAQTNKKQKVQSKNWILTLIITFGIAISLSISLIYICPKLTKFIRSKFHKQQQNLNEQKTDHSIKQTIQQNAEGHPDNSQQSIQKKVHSKDLNELNN